MFEIHTHKVEGDTNKQLGIAVTDEIGNGGAYHKYVIFDENYRKIRFDLGNTEEAAIEYAMVANIDFQDGTVLDKGINGVSSETLLAIVIHRLECFQHGPFKCETNRIALDNAKLTLGALKSRTMDRVRRGVEGMNKA